MPLVSIIEDDPSFYKLLTRRLKGFFDDVNFFHLTSLTEARARKEKILESQLIFLDQNLPDGRGVSLLEEGLFESIAVIAMSSEKTPEMAGRNVKAGAAYFLEKDSILQPLFEPLVLGILERNLLQEKALSAKLAESQLETVRTLVSTLKHEINNPLGAVLGAAYILGNSDALSQEQKDAVALLEASGNRIKHVLDELTKAISLDSVTKGQQKVFHVPGDKPWE